MNDHWYYWHDSTLVLKIHLQPKARVNAISGLVGRKLRIKIKSPPVDGKANAQLIDMLAADFGTKKAHVTIAAGNHARDKIIKIHGPVRLPEWFNALSMGEK